jgi:hypothetical protein
LKQWVGECNKKLLAKLNEKPKKENKPASASQGVEPESINPNMAIESSEGDEILDIPEVPRVA